MIFICTLVALLQIIAAQMPYHPESSPCTLRIPSLLLESGINLTDVRCADRSVPHLSFSSMCNPGSEHFLYCSPPLLIQRCKSGAVPTPEAINVITTDTSSPEIRKETFSECITLKDGVCTRDYHHFVPEISEEIPNRLQYDLKCTAGNDSVSSVSVAHCNSVYIKNVICMWTNETVITKPSNSLVELLTNYLLRNEERNVTRLSISNKFYKLEYYINFLDSPIIDYLYFNYTLEELINYNTLSNFPHLKKIHVQYLNVSRLPPNLFLRNKKLTSCAISHIMLEEVPPGLFNSAVDLIRVDLSGNKLQSLPEGIFQNNPSLRYLILAQNKLKHLPTTLLLNNNNIMVLDLSHNQLEDLQLDVLKNPPETTFGNFVNSRPIPDTFARRYGQWLKDGEKNPQIVNATIKTTTIGKIDLSYNRLTKIPNEVFDALTVLKIFGADFNREIRNLTGSHYFYALQEFSMSDCGIIDIDEDFFSKSSDNDPLFIKIIDLSSNRLNILRRRTFWNCRELEILLLNKNRLTKLENGLFKDSVNLIYLDLSGNMLSTFQYEAFNLRSVRVLDFSWNRIRDFDPKKMITLLESGLGFLKRLNISHNCLTTKKIVLPSIKANRSLFLKHVAVSYKYSSLTNRGIHAQQDSPGNRPNSEDDKDARLKLTLEIRIGPVEAETKLCPNPFERFCTYFPHSCHDISDTTWNLITERFKHLDLLQCREWTVDDNSEGDTIECPFAATCPQSHYKSILTSVFGNYESDVSFTCPLNDSCPPPCRCYQRAVEKEIVVDCNGKGLSHLPVYVPHNTNILYFSNNRLRTLHKLNSSMWSNLTELYLENNIIVSVHKISFPSKLQIVSLRNNQIQSIEKDSLDILTEVEFSLSGNPWLCDCNSLFLKAKLVGISKVKDAKLLFCDSFNDTLVNVPNDVLCPTKVYFTLSLRLALCLGIALPLSVGVLFVLYYRNKLLAKTFVFTYFPGISRYCYTPCCVDKEFDAFLAYNSSDRDIVMQMIEELENKKPSFKLCIHERDWIPGNPIITNIAESVGSSRKTIIILSMSFVQSTWLPVEIQTVYHQMVQDKINRSVIIVRGNIPRTSELDTYLQLLLRTKTYLVWGERWFWKKLRYALSHKDFSSLESERPSSNFVAKVEGDIVKSNGEDLSFC